MTDLSLHVATGITAAPRTVSYLPQTLASLELQAPQVHIFAEPSTELLAYPRCRTHQRAVRLGNWHNWRSMCEWLLRNTASPYILTAEDDVLFAPGAVETALEFARGRPDPVGFVSLYTSGAYRRLLAGRPTEGGFRQLRIHRLWGACAWLFPRKSLERILSHQLALRWDGENPQQARLDPASIAATDILVGLVLHELKLPTYFAVPSLVQHIGEHSAVGHTEGLTRTRTGLDFVGVSNP